MPSHGTIKNRIKEITINKIETVMNILTTHFESSSGRRYSLACHKTIQIKKE